MIAETMAALPADVSGTDREWAEAHLAEWAPRLDPAALGKLGARVLGFLDPDGPEPAADDKPAPAGELRLRDRRNGGVGFEGWLDGEHGPALRELIDQLAKPRPTSEGVPDPGGARRQVRAPRRRSRHAHRARRRTPGAGRAGQGVRLSGLPPPAEPVRRTPRAALDRRR